MGITAFFSGLERPRLEADHLPPSSAMVTICTAQWSLYVRHSGHCMYGTVVTICTAQWSLYVPHSDHYMYGTVVTICTAQWSLYIPPSGHHVYRRVVTICTAQWSIYVPTSSHYTYRTVVNICTTSLTFTMPLLLTCSVMVSTGTEGFYSPTESYELKQTFPVSAKTETKILCLWDRASSL